MIFHIHTSLSIGVRWTTGVRLNSCWTHVIPPRVIHACLRVLPFIFVFVRVQFFSTSGTFSVLFTSSFHSLYVRGTWKKNPWDVSVTKLYSLDHYKFKQHHALRFMFAKIHKQQLQSYFFHSRDRPQPLMSRCGEIRKKDISKLWILVMMTKDGGGLPGGGDGILHGFDFLNIWMVRHEKGVCVRNGILNRCDLPSQPFSTLTEMLRNRS